MARTVCRTMGAAFLLVLGISGAFADGPVIITQAKALAGGVTPGDRPGFPIEIRRSGVYRLGGDLTSSSGRNGIVVYAENVTIDLGGFNLRASQSAIVGRMSHLTVRNGSILKPFKGSIIYPSSVGGGDFWRIEDVEFVMEPDLYYSPVVIENKNGKGLLFRHNTVLYYGQVICGDYCHIEENSFFGTGSGSLTAIAMSSGSVIGNVVRNYRVAIQGRGASLIGFGQNVLLQHPSADEPYVRNVSPMTPNACKPAC